MPAVLHDVLNALAIGEIVVGGVALEANVPLDVFAAWEGEGAVGGAGGVEGFGGGAGDAEAVLVDGEAISDG